MVILASQIIPPRPSPHPSPCHFPLQTFSLSLVLLFLCPWMYCITATQSCELLRDFQFYDQGFIHKRFGERNNPDFQGEPWPSGHIHAIFLINAHLASTLHW